MIVVEGPDGAGKTTLIERISEDTGLKVAPRVVSKDAEAMVDLVKWTEDNVKAGFQDLIFDRHRLISEPIYGPVLRAAPQPKFNNLEWFYEQLHMFYQCSPIIIYCIPPLKTVWYNTQKGEDNKIFHGQSSHVHSIWGAYFNKATTESIFRNNTYIYDYTNDVDNNMLLPHIIRQINQKVNGNPHHDN
jgi:hypothetical protein